jgi:hypothetical protein
MKRAYIVSLIILVAAVAYLVISFNSLNIALKSTGYSSGDIMVLERGFNDNGKEFRIIKTSKDDNLALVCIEKNNMGFWTVSFSGGTTSPGTHLVSIGWIKSAGIRRYEANDSPSFSSEWHKLYYGDNAIKRINIAPEQLPPGVALNIQQTGSDYIIHLISYESPDVLNQIDMHSLLIEMNCIKE